MHLYILFSAKPTLYYLVLSPKCSIRLQMQAIEHQQLLPIAEKTHLYPSDSDINSLSRSDINPPPLGIPQSYSNEVRASAIARRTPKQTCDYPHLPLQKERETALFCSLYL
jgi:hypothetical protein